MNPKHIITYQYESEFIDDERQFEKLKEDAEHLLNEKLGVNYFRFIPVFYLYFDNKRAKLQIDDNVIELLRNSKYFRECVGKKINKNFLLKGKKLSTSSLGCQ